MTAKALTAEEIKMNLAKCPQWSYDEKKKLLWKKFEFKGFNKTMGMANLVAFLANKHNHHPDMHLSFGSCTLFFQTHDTDNGAVTELDFKLIKEIEAALA